MEAIFNAEYRYVWMVILAVLLFFPVRQMLWVLSVRRAIRKGGAENIDDAEQIRLKRRAGVTSAMLCILFSAAYTNVLFSS